MIAPVRQQPVYYTVVLVVRKNGLPLHSAYGMTTKRLTLALRAKAKMERGIGACGFNCTVSLLEHYNKGQPEIGTPRQEGA